jgi:hypothetical protein
MRLPADVSLCIEVVASAIAVITVITIIRDITFSPIHVKINSDNGIHKYAQSDQFYIVMHLSYSAGCKNKLIAEVNADKHSYACSFSQSECLASIRCRPYYPDGAQKIGA